MVINNSINNKTGYGVAQYPYSKKQCE